MDQLGSGRSSTSPPAHNHSSSSSQQQPSFYNLGTSSPPTSNPASPSVQPPFYSPLDLQTGANFSAYNNPVFSIPPVYPASNFGFNIDALGSNSHTEQFTEQELAELDDYLNRLSQQGSTGSLSPTQPSFLNNNTAQNTSVTDSFTQAAHSGRDLYEEALSQWAQAYPNSQESPISPNTTANTYNPFSSSIFSYSSSNAADSVTSGPPQYANNIENSSNYKKPSFADVAKHKAASKPKEADKSTVKRQNSAPDKQDASHTHHLNGGLKVNKALKRPKSAKPGGHRNKAVPVKPTEIKPDSRYGLDTFEVEGSGADHGKGKVSRSRKNSTSSLSSTMSGEDKDSAQHIPYSDSNKSTKSHTSTHIKEKKPRSRDDGKVFFDPRRIFQDSRSKSSAGVNNENFVPNNKQKIQPEKDKDKVKASVKSGSTKYINNDLRDVRKHTNVHNGGEEPNCKNDENDTMRKRTVSEGREGNKCKTKKAESSPQTGNTGPVPRGERGSKADWTQGNVKSVIGQWLISCWCWLRWLLREVGGFLYSLATLVLSVFLLLLALIFHYTLSFTSKLWSFMKDKIPYLRKNERFEWSRGSDSQSRNKFGLKEHIILPTTGDEAMRRLLSCKGKDPYSILGVRGDATDEDIKKYYRKQAFLVHPDKNKQPGAEEAFKILGHAFDLIGTPEKRKDYDSQYDKEDAEAAMQEFADLLSKLNDKMQEAANLLRCDHCGGKHKRVPTGRPMYAARFCDRCNTRHPAKEGDVWAESNMLGFLWHYFACMEGKVFDITEWAKCKRENFNQLQANAHQVIYRLTTTGGRPRHAQRSGEADLEDFLNTLFHQHTTTAGGATMPNPPPQQHSNHGNQSNNKKQRKKKKKH